MKYYIHFDDIGAYLCIGDFDNELIAQRHCNEKYPIPEVVAMSTDMCDVKYW